MKKGSRIFVGDRVLWIIFALLCGISLVAVYSAIGFSAIAKSNSTPGHIFLKHAVIVAVTWLCVLVLAHINYRYFSKPSKALFFIVLALLFAVLLVGREGRWFNLFGMSIQPSELAKIVLVVFLANRINANRDHIEEKQTFIVLLVPIILICFLVGIANLSSAILILVASYFTIFFGGVDRHLWWKYFIILAGLAIVGFVILYFVGDKLDVARSSTWGHRLQSWLHPNPNELTQENMVRMAVARGGFLGAGVGTTIHGRLMTQAHNDFIFAVILEEKGMLAGICIFALYCWFYLRCIRIATRCQGIFGSICVAGIGTIIFLQAITNMAVAVGLLPVTGQTLPFISYGGSAYIFLGCGIGIIQSVASDNRKKELAIAKQENTQDPNIETNNNEQ